MSASTTKNILVTGGNAGIGFALCGQLVADAHKVYLGARSAERGHKAIDDIKAKHPAADIELLVIDVSDDKSVADAAEKMKGVELYALVNNAGVGLQTGGGCEDTVLACNFYGPKRVTDAFVGQVTDRIVNTSSGVASMWLRKQDEATKDFYTNPATTWEQLCAAVEKDKSTGSGATGVYGVSKAGLNLITIRAAAAYPNLKVTALSPGFIATALTAGFGSKLTPEQGTVSLHKCLFDDVISGAYYGSDGLRSPLTVTRDPGMPEYQGEDESTIDKATYNK
jgi:NAD(P)-dependent dehydrogenase (short-subunit alcohol dehydrogenase family)